MKPALSLKGFTLIELLIVISLIIVITGSVIPSFNKYIDNQNVKQAQETVKDDLRTIQNKALNGELAQTELGSPAAKVNYWGIEFIKGDPTYTYFISVETNACGGAGTREDQGTSQPLPGEIVVRSRSSCVFFSFANGDITSRLSNNTITVGPNDSVEDNCRRLNVTGNGLIQLESGNGCVP